MKAPRPSLTGKFLLLVGLSTVLPLVTLTTTVLYQVYQAAWAQTNSSLEETSRRHAADVEARLAQVLGVVKALAALPRGVEVSEHLMSQSPELKDLWVRWDEQVDETAPRAALYQAVREARVEVLSAPRFDTYEASVGFPLWDEGQLVGMVGATFSLEPFQRQMASTRLLKTGYTILVSTEGVRMAHPDPRLIGTRMGNDVAPDQARAMREGIARGQAFTFDKEALISQQWSRLYFTPVRFARATSPWFLVVVVPFNEAQADLNALFNLLIGGVLATLVLVAGATWWSARSVVRPLRHLAAGAEALAEGKLDTRVTWSSHDEIGTLAESFNHMADRLVRSLQDQEELVRQRTARLSESLAELEQAHAKIVDTEKMAVLGQLAATIAHEINTPLGAIRSSATFLHQVASTRFGDFPDFLRSLSAADLAWYKALVVTKGVDLEATGGEDRRRRRALTKTLKALGVDDPEGLADDIVFLVGPDQDEAMVEAVAAGRGPVVRRASETAAQVQSTSIILEAADRAAGTVAALVDYARGPEVVQDQRVDPARELETLVTLYYGVAKKGVEVVREFEPGALVLGDRDKLNQVWVNLINNALQAMNQKGRLVLRTRTTSQGVEISVANNGPPIPPEHRNKIFQPFFTTKKAGEGTGLGLDICRRIVEAHQGTLVLSQEGVYTVFTVTLPAPPHHAP